MSGGVHAASYGALESLWTSVYWPPPATRNWKVTAFTPAPVSDAVAVSAEEPVPSVAPSSGAVSVPVAAVLSMRVVTVALVPVLFWASLASARRS